ncbi:efflux RND transporter periplasmic adaptor subunit [Arcobacter arenosus]|uniref:HlyD family efflux transporter periplasmic adaptor subunit n=1 Tax=Arcobacter arenosus TaxID=2576037 RepID=A0A5R8Y261_9BACT|nr:efflux RND transporter periplasmic adaptor subunit [Arcobacter arenosus]TLP39256.1 HlyD family efflux transporter periplasmic adaptor subunit [Arcobacter arenosus]
MRTLIISLLLGFAVLNAQILEVEQLFNKKLTEVKKEQIGTLKSFYGHMKINETKIYDVVTRFDGYITKLDANEQYKFVKKGESLFSLYSDEINSISQEIKIAKRINKNLLKGNIEKLKSLDLDKKTINKIVNSKNIIEEISIYSPIDSIILNKSINNGSFVKKGKLLLQLAPLDELWFIASVYQKDLTFLKEGMEAKITIDGFEKPVISKVDKIYPNIDLKTKTVDVRFIVPNKDLKLFPNMFAKVLIRDTQKEILTLPKTAVLSKGDKYYAFEQLSKSQFEPIEIKAKRISSNKYEILDGLKEGQKVVDNALFLLDSDAITNGLYSSDDDDW